MNAVQKSNVYFFHGPDTYRAWLRLQEWKQAFIAKYGQGSVREFEIGQPLNLSGLAGESSLFNHATLTIIRDPFGFDDYKALVSPEEFADFFKQELAGANHILFWQRGALPVNYQKKLQEAERGGKIQVYEFDYLNEAEGLKFLAWEFKKLNFKIARDAAETLFSFCLNQSGFFDSSRAVQSVKQLAGYCLGREIVTLSDVLTVITPTNNEDAFLPALRSFSKANYKEFNNNLDIIFKNAASEQELLGILSALFEQVKNMLLVMKLAQAGNDLLMIDKQLGFKAGRSRYVLSDAKKFGIENLETILDKLIEIEYNVKQGRTVLAPELGFVLKAKRTD